MKETNAQKIIFDNPLRPVQAYNLAKLTGVEAIDRFQLILEIFTKKATTVEAKLQIQLAKLQYELTHAKERVRLAKMGEQPGFMGLGAYEADVYHEAVKRQVHAIKRKLRKIRGRRQLHRARRAELGFSSISLSGYTNAGKSSLFNALTEEEVPVDSALFTTLSTTTRLVKIADRKFLLTDTVGFIDRLPLTLIEAFRSTLEETIYSDLILLVVDISEPINTVEKKLNVCLETIESIGAAGIPVITALNKTDLLSQDEINLKVEALRDKAPDPTLTSALRGTNIELLKEKIIKKLQNSIQIWLTIPLMKENMQFISWLFQRADVQLTNYDGDSVHMVLEATPNFAEKIRSQARKFNGKIGKIQQ